MTAPTREARTRAAPARRCSRCGTPKPLAPEFYEPRPNRPSGFGTICKVCRNASRRKGRGAATAETLGILAGPHKTRDQLAPDILKMVSEPKTADKFETFFTRYSGMPLPTHAKLWVTAALSNDATIINTFPGSAKSTIMAEWWPIYLICCDPNVEILIVSKTIALGQKLSRKIAHHLEYDHKLIGDFGRFRGEGIERPWRVREGELEVDGSDRDKKSGDLTLQIRGAMQQVLGFRCHWLIADDPTDESVARSEAQRTQAEDWFKSECLSRLRPDGKAICIGQRVHMADLYGTLSEQVDDLTGELVWHVERTPAVLSWGNAGGDGDVNESVVLWPEFWPIDKLLKKRRMLGSARFETYYQQNPQAGAVRAVAELAWLTGTDEYPGCFDRERRAGEPPKLQGGLLAPVVRVVSVDPGITRFAGIVIADVEFDWRDRTNVRYHVIDVLREQIRWEALRSLLLELRDKYGAKVLILESNTLKNVQQDASYRSLVSAYDQQVISHNTTNSSKNDPNVGLYAMSRIFELGQVRIPYASGETQEVAHLLIDETLGNKTTTDVLMALWFTFNRTGALRSYVPGMLPTSFTSPMLGGPRSEGAWRTPSGSWGKEWASR